MIRRLAGSKFSLVYLVISFDSFIHLANKYLLSIYYVLSPDLGAGDSAANKLREGPFSNRIYRLMAIGDKEVWGWVWRVIVQSLPTQTVEPTKWEPRSCSPQSFSMVICPE